MYLDLLACKRHKLGIHGNVANDVKAIALLIDRVVHVLLLVNATSNVEASLLEDLHDAAIN